MFRWISATLIAILLVSPIWKRLHNEIEKPTYVFAVDNSESLMEGLDSAMWLDTKSRLLNASEELVENDFDIEFRTLSDKRLNNLNDVAFNAKSTDLNDLLKNVNADYEGRNLGGIILVSDGIHNQGLLPTYSYQGKKVHAVGLGDTVPKADIILSSLLYNKISYQGNKFPLVAQINQKGFTGETVSATVFQSGNRIASKSVRLASEQEITEVRFELEAARSGYNGYTVSVEQREGEFNLDNNTKKAYVEVVEGQEKIALIAPAPHPDVKALRSAIESNQNYTFQQFILSIPQDLQRLTSSKEKYDLIILHQLPDRRRLADRFIEQFKKSGASLLWVYGGLTDVRRLNEENNLLFLDLIGGEYDQVTAYYNPGFTSFTLSDDLQRSFDGFPPLTVPFGKITRRENVSDLLNQRVGSLNTNKPLIAISDSDGTRSGLILGSDIWRWKLADYARNDNNELFNELISKLVQYLSSKEDKRKFKFYPITSEFDVNDPVLFESEVYNDLYERVYGNRIDLQITDDTGKKSNYIYIPAEGNTQYALNDLQAGVYRYDASTTLVGERMTASGEFVVREIELEKLNLTADFGLLRKLAENSGGSFFNQSQLDELTNELANEKSQGIIRTDEKYLPFINLQWIFVLILILVSAEWFVRKFSGSY